MWKPRKTVGQMVEEAKTRIENLSVEQVEAEMARGDVQVLDIRDVRERRKLGFVPGSQHVPRGMLEFWLDPTSHYYTGKVDPTKRIIVYCAGGQRSALAADVLREMGFPNVAHLEVGFNGWAAARRAYAQQHPTRPALVIEVSESSLALDRDYKGSLYARAHLDDYWIVNLIDRVVEVYRQPVPDSSAPYGWRYASREVLAHDASVELLAVPSLRLRVSDLLP